MEKLHFTEFRKGFPPGYNKICRLGEGSEHKTEFGVRILSPGKKLTEHLTGEKCFLLLKGKIELETEGKNYRFSRNSIFDQNPATFSLGKNKSFTLKAAEETELVELATGNEKDFSPIVVAPDEVMS